MKIQLKMCLFGVAALLMASCSEPSSLPDVSAAFVQEDGSATGTIIATEGQELYGGEVSGSINGDPLTAGTGIATGSVLSATNGASVSFLINLDGSEVLDSSLAYPGDITLSAPAGPTHDPSDSMIVIWSGGSGAEVFSIAVFQEPFDGSYVYENYDIPPGTTSVTIPAGTFASGESYELIVEGIKTRILSGEGFGQGSLITAGAATHRFDAP